jgi:hypothetical protein
VDGTGLGSCPIGGVSITSVELLDSVSTESGLFRDPTHPNFGGTVPILRAVFHVPPGYMEGHTFVPLFKTFGLH